MATPFEHLFDDVDTFNELLDEGPDTTDEQFIADLKNAVLNIASKVEALTPEDVEREFTDEDEDEDESEAIEAQAV